MTRASRDGGRRVAESRLQGERARESARGSARPRAGCRCAARASPRTRLTPASPASPGRFLTTEPPRKPRLSPLTKYLLSFLGPAPLFTERSLMRSLIEVSFPLETDEEGEAGPRRARDLPEHRRERAGGEGASELCLSEASPLSRGADPTRTRPVPAPRDATGRDGAGSWGWRSRAGGRAARAPMAPRLGGAPKGPLRE